MHLDEVVCGESALGGDTVRVFDRDAMCCGVGFIYRRYAALALPAPELFYLGIR